MYGLCRLCRCSCVASSGWGVPVPRLRLGTADGVGKTSLLILPGSHRAPLLGLPKNAPPSTCSPPSTPASRIRLPGIAAAATLRLQPFRPPRGLPLFASARSCHASGPVPPSRFLTALTGFSCGEVRVYCAPLPIMGFAGFQALIATFSCGFPGGLAAFLAVSGLRLSPMTLAVVFLLFRCSSLTEYTVSVAESDGPERETTLAHRLPGLREVSEGILSSGVASGRLLPFGKCGFRPCRTRLPGSCWSGVGRAIPTDALHTLRSVPLIQSRVLSPRSWPSCRFSSLCRFTEVMRFWVARLQGFAPCIRCLVVTPVSRRDDRLLPWALLPDLYSRPSGTSATRRSPSDAPCGHPRAPDVCLVPSPARLKADDVIRWSPRLRDHRRRLCSEERAHYE